MRLLIVEDDSFKLNEITKIVNDVLGDVEIDHSDNVHDTIVCLENMRPDRIVLDMSLPSHPGRPGEGNPLPMPDGGIEVILELRSLGCSDIPIIVITQYPGIEIESEYYAIKDAGQKIKDAYEIKNLSVTEHSSDNSDWKEALRGFLEP